MATRYLIQHEEESRLALIVEVVDDALAREDEMKELMLDFGCAHAMLIDKSDVIVLRDTFISTDESSIKVDFKVSTKALLAPGIGLDERARAWLQSMSENWRFTLSDKEVLLEKLLGDIVPALSGARIRREVDDAA